MIRLSIDLNDGFSKNLAENHAATWFLLALSVWLISGCSPVPTSSQLSSPSALQPVEAEQVQAESLSALLASEANTAIPALIVAERAASSARDLATLSSLWQPDARIVDGRNTADPADDYIWPNRAAILDRYELAVFPNPPPRFEDVPTFDITHDTSTGDPHATVVNGVDEWQFIYSDGRWWITELAYQRP